MISFARQCVFFVKVAMWGVLWLVCAFFDVRRVWWLAR